MADITTMFHQVKVPDSDADFLRFLQWPEGDVSQPPVEHRMTVHLSGATSSLSCARAMHLGEQLMTTEST